MHLAPITLFVYNRPWHTQQTIGALLQNELASSHKLFIFSDGPKNDKDAPAVHEIRDYIKGIGGFVEIEIIARDKNWGLADNIIDGVTRVVNEYGRIIVLEDDLVTSPYFLRFMNEALEFYKNEPKVWHISGYSLPIDVNFLEDIYFYRATSCWGWATWKDKWKFFGNDVDKIESRFSKNDIYKFNLENSYNFWGHFQKNKEGSMKTWAIFWYATVFLNNGLCLHPSKSYVKNIGHDGTGVHCGGWSVYNKQALKQNIRHSFDINIAETQAALESIKRFYRKSKNGYFFRFLQFIKRIIK